MKKIVLLSFLSLMFISIASAQSDKTNKRISTGSSDKAPAGEKSNLHPVSSKRMSSGNTADEKTITPKPSSVKVVSNKRIHQAD